MRVTASMNLRKASRLENNSAIAFVGAGGKTTAMFQLARQAKTRVIVACTTHLACSQASLADQHIVVSEKTPDIGRILGDHPGVTLFTGSPDDSGKLTGLPHETMNDLMDYAQKNQIPILVEADGSKNLPLKAPASHEPAIPESVDHVVVVSGLNGIGKPLGKEYVHRAELFGRLSGRSLGDLVLSDDLISVLLHREGGLKNIPTGARKSVLLTHADATPPDVITEIIQPLSAVYDAVIVADLAAGKVRSATEKITGIILAGGGSSRFGSPKQIAIWEGKPMIRHIAEKALTAGLSQVIVVTGASEAPIRRALHDLPVTFAPNPDWQSGQSSSIRAGLERVSPSTGAALFLLSDQPQVEVDLIAEVMSWHHLTLEAVIAPTYAGERGNPVLFDRTTFSSLRSLQGDIGGRAIFNDFPPFTFPWRNSLILKDADTPGELAGLGKS